MLLLAPRRRSRCRGCCGLQQRRRRAGCVPELSCPAAPAAPARTPRSPAAAGRREVSFFSRFSQSTHEPPTPQPLTHSRNPRPLLRPNTKASQQSQQHEKQGGGAASGPPRHHRSVRAADCQVPFPQRIDGHLRHVPADIPEAGERTERGTITPLSSAEAQLRPAPQRVRCAGWRWRGVTRL